MPKAKAVVMTERTMTTDDVFSLVWLFGNALVMGDVVGKGDECVLFGSDALTLSPSLAAEWMGMLA